MQFDIAMSYELYPPMLEFEDGSSAVVEKYRRLFAKARNIKQAARKIDNDKFGTFVNRCARGGLEVRDLAAVFEAQLNDGRDLQTVPDRFELMAKCCRMKMQKEGKSRWGLKCNNRYREYLEIWPDAFFLNMVRDGRDVLASQLNTGNFQKTPEALGRSWANTHRSFKAILDDDRVNAYEVIYETLVSDPRKEIKNITDFLKLDFSPDMLEFHNKDLTIYSSSHLSMPRISVEIDTTKVGRWKNDLTPEQAREFCQATDGLMSEYNYV